MPSRLAHRHIHAAMTALGEAKIVNLDSSLRNLINPVAESLARGGIGEEVGFHVLCCDEYFLVTGLTGGRMSEVEGVAESIRRAIAPGREG